MLRIILVPERCVGIVNDERTPKPVGVLAVSVRVIPVGTMLLDLMEPSDNNNITM